jgi:Cu/Ag efflux protein CusF
MGKIIAITPTAVTIAHEAVPSLQWDAMTMTFAPPAAGMPADIAVGDQVHFSFTEAGNGQYRIENIGKHGAAGEMP